MATKAAISRLPRGPRRRSGVFNMSHGLLYALAIICAIGFTVPFIWTLGTSLKPLADLYTFPPKFLPSAPRWENYNDVFTLAPFATFLWNSVIITGWRRAGNALGRSGGVWLFALSLPRSRYAVCCGAGDHDAALACHNCAVVFAARSGLDQHLSATDCAVVLWRRRVLHLSAAPVLLTVPRDVDEAAKIDGANSIQILLRIMLPLANTALATVAIFAFIDHWNEFIGPLIFLNSPEKFTVAIGLRYFIVTPFTGDEPREAILMAASLIIVALPPLALFFAAQKYFLQVTAQAETTPSYALHAGSLYRQAKSTSGSPMPRAGSYAREPPRRLRERT